MKIDTMNDFRFLLRSFLSKGLTEEEVIGVKISMCRAMNVSTIRDLDRLPDETLVNDEARKFIVFYFRLNTS